MKALALGTLLLAAPTPALAQTRVGVQAGGAITTALVRDSITEPLAVRSAPGPGVRFTLDTRLNAAYHVGVSLATTWGPLQERTPGSSRDIVQLVSWHPAVTLRRRVRGALSAHASVGALVYRPDRSAGTLFARGAPILPVIGLGLGFERTVGRDIALVMAAEYDVHRFTTTALRDNGFAGERVVHRVIVSFGVTRGL